MKKLIMLRGLPASGKSTYAKEMVRKHGYKRVNRDDLREMIDLGKYSPESEIIIKEVQEQIIRRLIRHNQTVIVDNTNLKPEDQEYFEYLADEDLEVKLEIIDFPTPVDECVRRDSLRGIHSVGEKVIRDMYEKYLK